MQLTINLTEAKQIIKANILDYIGRGGQVKRTMYVLYGPPGVGKTAMGPLLVSDLNKEVPKQFPKLMNEEELWKFFSHNVPCLDPMHTMGFAEINKDRETEFSRPPILPTKTDGRFGVMMLDDITGGLQALQKSLFSLNEHRLGRHYLPEFFFPIFSGNYSTDQSGAIKMLRAFSDRLIKLHVRADFVEWKKFALQNGIHPLIVAFLSKYTHKLSTYVEPGTEDKDSGKSFERSEYVSPRTWDIASSALHCSENLSETLLAAQLHGSIGEGMATELLAFKKFDAQCPDVEDLLRGKFSDYKKGKPDLDYTIASNLVYTLVRILKSTKKKDKVLGIARKKVIENFLNFTLNHLPVDFGTVCLQDIFNAISVDQITELTDHPYYDNNYKKIAKYIDPVGAKN